MREIDTNNTSDKRELKIFKKKRKRRKVCFMLHNRFFVTCSKGSPSVADSKLMVVRKRSSWLATPAKLRSRRNETK